MLIADLRRAGGGTGLVMEEANWAGVGEGPAVGGNEWAMGDRPAVT